MKANHTDPHHVLLDLIKEQHAQLLEARNRAEKERESMRDNILQTAASLKIADHKLDGALNALRDIQQAKSVREARWIANRFLMALHTEQLTE